MTRYHVASAGNCESVRQAINAGWRTGPAQYAEHWVNGVLVRREPVAEWEQRTGRPVGWLQLLPADRVIVAGAEAVLELPEDGLTGQHIAEQLGKTIGGVPTPLARDCVQVSRARDHASLPAGVRDLLDDRYVDRELAEEDTPQRRAAIAQELTNGGRAAAALARKDARGARVEIDKALGLAGGGRSR